ncbi:MAG: hypothetical protein COB02_11420 [Candidatus Cloacimonadota bacterium]|nr:MAG: hypothetical protein COB02_11420 [Candidatus Cloacimonadota bacterium]
MLITRKNINTNHQVATNQIQIPSFEVKLEAGISISKKVQESVLNVNSPVDTQTVMQAANLIQGMLLANTKDSILTQANIDRGTVKLLLDLDLDLDI